MGGQKADRTKLRLFHRGRCYDAAGEDLALSLKASLAI